MPSLSKRMPYAELHLHSHWSPLEGASSPLELVLEDGRVVTVYRDLTHNHWYHQ